METVKESDRRKVGMSLLERYPHFSSTPGRFASIYLRDIEVFVEWIHANASMRIATPTISLPNQVSSG
jgi:hypothetical protein